MADEKCYGSAGISLFYMRDTNPNPTNQPTHPKKALAAFLLSGNTLQVKAY